MSKNELDLLRRQIDQIDNELLTLARRRLDTALKIGQIKIQLDLPTRDFAREKQSIELIEQKARVLGLPTSLARHLLEELVRASLTTQEQDRLAKNAHHNRKRALVIGGNGKMGQWFAQFLTSQGFDVDIADPHFNSDILSHEVIVVATPLSVSNAILLELAQLRPHGLVFDICSLKEPVRTGLLALRDAGLKVCSLHPMFGPDTNLLSGKHVVLVDVGHSEANREAEQLFGQTMASVVQMSMDEHDRSMAYLLGLSHALNIAFFTTLKHSGQTAPRLMELSSTTFGAQLQIAANVASENPHLYYDIQHLNPYGDVALASLADALLHMRDMIKRHDEIEFVGLMQEGYDYLRSVGHGKN